jgi:hypothetical protein
MSEGYGFLFKIAPVSVVVMIALTVVSLIFLPLKAAAGVFVGGSLVCVNLVFFHLLLKPALRPKTWVTPKRVLPGYYLLFFITVVIVFLLIYSHVVNPLGLLLGLSTFIITIFSVLVPEVGAILFRKHTKEAT